MGTIRLIAAMFVGLTVGMCTQIDFSKAAWEEGDIAPVRFFCDELGARAIYESPTNAEASVAAANMIANGSCVQLPYPVPGKLTSKIDGPKAIDTIPAGFLELWTVQLGESVFWAIMWEEGKGV